VAVDDSAKKDLIYFLDQTANLYPVSPRVASTVVNARAGIKKPVLISRSFVNFKKVNVQCIYQLADLTGSINITLLEKVFHIYCSRSILANFFALSTMHVCQCINYPK